MADPVTLTTIKETAAALDRSGLTTLEDLRLWISKDVDKSISLLAESSGTKQSLLIALLIAEFCDDASRSGRPTLASYWRGLKTVPGLIRFYVHPLAQRWREKGLAVLGDVGQAAWYILRQLVTRHRRLWYNWRRHWADALLIVVLPGLLIGFWFRVESAKTRQVRSVAVKRSVKVVPLQRISTDDIELAADPNSSGAFTSVDQVQGRYALVPLHGGATILRDQILSAELSNKVQNRVIVSIPLKAGTTRDLSPPSEVFLLLSAREIPAGENATTSAQYVFGVVLLGLEKTREVTTATVAMVKEDLDKAAPLLGSRDAYLSQSAR